MHRSVSFGHCDYFVFVVEYRSPQGYLHLTVKNFHCNREINSYNMNTFSLRSSSLLSFSSNTVRYCILLSIATHRYNLATLIPINPDFLGYALSDVDVGFCLNWPKFYYLKKRLVVRTRVNLFEIHVVADNARPKAEIYCPKSSTIGFYWYFLFLCYQTNLTREPRRALQPTTLKLHSNNMPDSVLKRCFFFVNKYYYLVFSTYLKTEQAVKFIWATS